MDDVVGLLVSLNKISLVALVVIIGFLSYQIYLLKKEAENKKKKLTIPDFKETIGTNYPQPSQIINKDQQKLYTKSSLMPIIIGVVLFFIFGLIFILGFLKSKSTTSVYNQDIIPTPIVNFVASKGIKIYNQNWKLLSDEAVKKVLPGQHITIGIETVKNTDIDMARIRVNKNKWEQKDITFQFNKETNTFYKDYIISTGEAALKIEAELHSKADGWLGD